MKSVRLHLIRHGITRANLEGLYLGHGDMPLCPEGISELEKLAAEYDYPEASVVFSSPLERCLQTARLIYPDKQPVVFDELIEYNMGSFDSKSAAELKNHPLFARWLSGDPDVQAPFGESAREFSNRVCGGFKKLAEAVLSLGQDNVAVVTHAGVISTILANFALPELKAHEWGVGAGCGYTVRLDSMLWSSGGKVEALCAIPEKKSQTPYYDGWDYYPSDDDFDISEYLNDYPLPTEE